MAHNENLELDQEQEIDLINLTIRRARKSRLEGEVIRASLLYMQENAGCSISEALHNGQQQYGI